MELVLSELSLGVSVLKLLPSVLERLFLKLLVLLLELFDKAVLVWKPSPIVVELWVLLVFGIVVVGAVAPCWS